MPRQISLFGTLSISEDGRPSELLRNAKGCALLVHLLIRGQPETRDYLADLLWDSSNTASSLRNLRVLLTRIRPHLPGLDITRRTIAYRLQGDEAVDYLALAAGLSEDNSQMLAALQLYRGELLEGFYLDDAPRFMEWLTVERERMRRTVLDAHARLCLTLASEKRWQEGADVAARWLRIDNLDEEALRWRLQFLAANGQLTTALQIYEDFRQLLREELDAEPEAATLALVNELTQWSESSTTVTLNVIRPDHSPHEILTSAELAEPGRLPANAILPYRRNADFVGREAELLQIAAALGERADDDRPPLAAITGIGGLGKTQTAVEFCYRYGRYFSGGVFWLSFAEAENVAEEVAAVGSERGLGLFRDAEELTLAERTGRVQRAWQEPVPRLLIFDNCEDEALLDRWVPVTGGCHVLATSRRAQWSRSLGIKTIPLLPLSADQSSRLLQRLAPHLTATEAAEIAGELGHLPLALHLAGSFLHRYQQISPSTYISQFREQALLQHPSLHGRGVRYSPTGHELDVARTFALSWEQLDPANEVDATARQLLACAACLAPGEPIPVEWLKTVANHDTNDIMMTLQVEDGLSRLVTAGFLTMDQGQTVVLHRLIALFTQEACGAAELEAARTAVAGNMAELLSSQREREAHLSTLPFTVAHLRHVAEVALARKSQHAAILCTILGIHLGDIGSNSKAEQILQRGCAVAAEIGDTLGNGKALNALASTQDYMGRYQESLRSAQQAVALFEAMSTPNTAGLAEALYRQGWASYRLGQIDEALSAAEAALALSRAANLHAVQAYSLSLLGVVNYYVLGYFDVAQEQLEGSLAVYRQLGNRRGESVVLNNMGESARLQGNYRLAAHYYEEALAIAQKIQYRSRADLILSNLCGARISLGQYDAAAADLALLVARTEDSWFGMSEALRFLAEAYLGQGRVTEALATGQRALTTAIESDPFERGRAWRVLGHIMARLEAPAPAKARRANGQLYDAPDCYDASLRCFERGHADRDRAVTLWYWAHYEIDHGDERRGETMWREAREIFTRLKLPLMVAAMDQQVA